MRIGIILNEAEMQPDYCQTFLSLAESGDEIFILFNKKVTNWPYKHKRLHYTYIEDNNIVKSIIPFTKLFFKSLTYFRKKNIDLLIGTGGTLSEAYLCSLILKKPIVSDIRNPWYIQEHEINTKITFKGKIARITRKLRYFIERKLIHKSIGVIAYSDGLKEWFIKVVGINPGRLATIYPHINLDLFHPKTKPESEYSKKSDFPVIVYVGVIFNSRGIDQLLKAIGIVKKKYRNVKTIIVGNLPMGVYTKELFNIIKKFDIKENIAITGYQPFKKIPRILSRADICIVPHRRIFTYEISPPVKTFEYMSMAKSVIVTDVGMERFVKHMYNGLVVKAKGEFYKEFANNIIKLCDNEKMRKKLGKNAREFIRKNHNLNDLKIKYRKVLLNFMNKK